MFTSSQCSSEGGGGWLVHLQDAIKVKSGPLIMANGSTSRWEFPVFMTFQ